MGSSWHTPHCTGTLAPRSGLDRPPTEQRLCLGAAPRLGRH
jgi:hypothetical protein